MKKLLRDVTFLIHDTVYHSEDLNIENHISGKQGNVV